MINVTALARTISFLFNCGLLVTYTFIQFTILGGHIGGFYASDIETKSPDMFSLYQCS